MKKIIVIEDDKDLAELIEIHLKDLSCEVEKYHSGNAGLNFALNNDADLIILDLMLPDADGMDICRKLKMEKVKTPIIMLTAKSEEIDKIIGLESGADDYITKPFSIREFIARVKVIFRRNEEQSTASEEDEKTIYSFDNLEVNTEKRIVLLDKERIDLTPKEFDLLVLMSKHPGRSYSREDLLNFVWGYQFAGYEHTVNSHINRLRAKIEKNPSEPKFILTTWGIGYRFNDSLN